MGKYVDDLCAGMITIGIGIGMFFGLFLSSAVMLLILIALGAIGLGLIRVIRAFVKIEANK